MSLGIKSIWRVRPRINRPLSLVPGDCSSLLLRQSSVTNRQARVSARPKSTAAIPRDERDSLNITPSPATLATSPPPSAVPTLIQRLAHVPVRRHGPRQSVLVEPPTVYPNKRETRRSMRKNRQGNTRQHLLERIRVTKTAALPDWRLILWNLSRWTPEYSEEHVNDVIKVIIPSGSADVLLLDGQNSVWDIRARTQCTMKMHPGSRSDDNPYLLLSGPRSAVGAAVQDILKACKSATVVPLVSAGEGAATGKSLEDAQHEPQALITIPARKTPLAREPYTLGLRAQDIMRPNTWTSESFEAYVAALVYSRMAPSLASQLYPGKISHNEAVINHLHKAFKDPATRNVLSCAAFKMALWYMARNGVTDRPHARALYARMEVFGLRMDTDVFNALAESAVAAKDLLFFGTVLRLMRRRGHAPNLRTWFLFLRMIEAEEVKRYILHAMDRKGLLSAPGAIKFASFELVHADIERAIQQGKDLPTFLADQDGLYGSEWRTRSNLHRVIEVLGRHGRLGEALQVVDIMLSRDASCHPNTFTLNTLLTHCKLQNRMHEAFQVLGKFDNHTSAPADPVTYHLLFEMAWQSKSPHTLGLVWRYACLVNGTSYRMRRRITTILRGHRGLSKQFGLNGLEGTPESNDAGWNQLPLDSDPAMVLFHEFLSLGGLEEAVNTLRDNWVSARFITEWYSTHFKDQVPACGLGDLMSESLRSDAQVHRDIKEGRRVELRHIKLPTMPKRMRPSVDASKQPPVGARTAGNSVSDGSHVK